jgi:hypothetical protein
MSAIAQLAWNTGIADPVGITSGNTQTEFGGAAKVAAGPAGPTDPTAPAGPAGPCVTGTLTTLPETTNPGPSVG